MFFNDRKTVEVLQIDKVLRKIKLYLFLKSLKMIRNLSKRLY